MSSASLRLGAGLILALLGCPLSAQVPLSGHVVDQNEAPVAGALVSARQGQAPPVTMATTPAGDFHLKLPAPGTWLVTVNRTGYYQLRDRPVDVPAAGTQITLVLNVQKEVFQSVTVGAMPSPVDPQQTQREQHLSGTTINNVPYPESHSLINTMKLMPGVIQDPTGAVHFHGGSEYQTEYRLDGFDISDPIDGRFTTRLAVEGVQSMSLVSSRESPQYGYGSAGMLNIQTENGTDRLHYTSTDFIPGLNTQNGFTIGDWTPRAVISGPIVKGHAWFSDSLDAEYNTGFINGLPNGQNTNALWALSNLAHIQVNVTQANILYADFLTSYDHQSHYGLGVLDPDSTTTALSDNEWLAAFKDQYSWESGSVLEGGFAFQRVYHLRTPFGNAPYLITPEGRSGNYFAQSQEDGRRSQLFVNYYPHVFHFLGRHQIQTGADAQRLDYIAQFHRTSFDIIGLSGLPLYQTSFTGSGDFQRPGAVVSSYLNDHWQLSGRFFLDLGVRQVWDELVRQVAFAPRISFAWAPFNDARTKVTGGYAITDDATNLAIFSRPLDQQAITTPYTAAGVAEAPLLTTFLPGHDLAMPRYTNWSAGVQHDFGRRVSGDLEWLRKRGTDGFVYAPLVPPVVFNVQPQLLGYGFGGTYQLSNDRQDKYDEVTLTVHQSFGEEYEWLMSYTRSRAVSNSVLDFNVDQPLQVLNYFAPVPWDSPNRIMGWAYLPTPWKNWAVSTLVDYRTGFPFPAITDAGAVVGLFDSHRYPSTFDLDIAIERRFEFRGYRFAVRVGLNNITDHLNPTAVNNVVGAPQFLQFFGYEGRHAELRIRFFGKATPNATP